MLQIQYVAVDMVRLLRAPIGQIETADRDLGRQLRRAAASVVLNLAEGSGSSGGTRRERYRSALGSLREVEAALLRSKELEARRVWPRLDVRVLRRYLRRVQRLLADRYELGARLGRGSMGEVWAATDLTTSEEVAVKIALASTLADPELLARFEREGKLLKRLRTPHVCGFRAASRTDDGTPFLVVERLWGETLEALLAREGDLPLAETLRIGREILGALVVAHDAGVVHRDLSTANVFLHQEPNGAAVTKVLDFGVAKAAASSLSASVTSAGFATESGATIGTLAYVAPEQLGGSTATGPRADLYAAGTVLFRALTGRLPFGDAQGARLLTLKREHDPPSVDDLTGERWPVGVRTFLEKMMARSVARRYSSAVVALAALEALEAPVPARAEPRRAPAQAVFEPSATQTLGPPRRRPPG